jgi:hypothetical protein
MLMKWTILLGCCAILGGCGGTDPVEAAPAPATYALRLDVTLEVANNQLGFLTPSNTIVTYPATEFVGKPYLIGLFPGGFSAGNDPPLEHVWGTLPSDLKVSFVSSKGYENGPYDVVFVGYKTTPITPDIQNGPAQSAPPAKGGDIASFTLSTADVRPGDPQNPLGTVRLNVEGADGTKSLKNRTPMDPNDPAQATAAFENTILTIP